MSKVTQIYTFKYLLQSCLVHIELLCIGRMNVCLNGAGHVTKMATMPICGKNLLKSSSPKATGRLPSHLVHSIRDWGPTKLVQMMILG